MEGSLRLGDLKIYRESFSVSNYVWRLLHARNYVIVNTIGQQFIRAADSISANIAEGFGRYSKKEKIRFYLYARGSVYESLDWLEKCRVRNIISLEDYSKIRSILSNLPLKLNAIMKSANRLKK